MSRIIVDAMGGDYAPTEIIRGAVQAWREYEKPLTLIGRQSVVTEELQAAGADPGDFEIVDASEVIGNEDTPTVAIKRKKDSSLVKAFELLRQDRDGILITAGSTGAVLTGALLKVGRIKGVSRPGLAPLMPNPKGGSLLIDCGANVDCKPENLLDFAIMGSIYMEQVMGRTNPSVGLINNGVEEKKGNALVKEAHQLLKQCPSIHFAGNTEAREVTAGVVDVLVCDGFVGNVVLKEAEGVAMTLMGMIKEAMFKSFLTKMAALILKPGLKSVKSLLNAEEYGGAPLLGIDGGVIKAHGNSNAYAFKNAIRQAILFRDNHVLEHIRAHMAEKKEAND
jgi:glycerol-3-phosphate acyltransferase PlsX